MIRAIGPASMDQLEKGLKRLKLRHTRDTLEMLNDLAMQEEPAYLDFLAYMVEQEVAARDETQRQQRRKAARFPVYRTLDSFDFRFQTSVSPQTMRDLATLQFVKAKENVILLGPPGVGKMVCCYSQRGTTRRRVRVPDPVPPAA